VSDRRDGLVILGVGAAACAVCCAGPILALLGGLSIAGFVSAAFIGVAGLVIAFAASAAWLILRRQRTRPAAPSTSTPVAAPTLRRPTRTSASQDPDMLIEQAHS
jgi:hypothetical protein